MKTLKQVLSLTLVLTSLWGIQTLPLTNKSLAFSKTVKAAVLGDNYPHKWQKGWELILGACTCDNARPLLLFA
ncbi:hypothetical protein ABG752_09755 [Streptococcus iniae]